MTNHESKLGDNRIIFPNKQILAVRESRYEVVCLMTLINIIWIAFSIWLIIYMGSLTPVGLALFLIPLDLDFYFSFLKGKHETI